MARPSTADYRTLAAFRRSVRALNLAVEEGVRVAGLTVPQQGLLLALRARGATRVPLAALREELRTDTATMAELIARLGRRGLITRHAALARDGRAADITLTLRGRAALERSVSGIRRRIRRAAADGELKAMRRDLDAYFRFYTGSRRRASGSVRESR